MHQINFYQHHFVSNTRRSGIKHKESRELLANYTKDEENGEVGQLAIIMWI